MKRIIDEICRFGVGGLFIFSGLIKLNDPIGTEIKLDEYFVVFAADFASFFSVFQPFAMVIGFTLIVLEVVLGVAVLMKYKMNVTTWILLLIIMFFTFLTFYSAYFDKVTDCGCFGDAIPLTPWQSFYKDVILVLLIAHLFWYRSSYEPVFRKFTGNMIIVSVTIVSFIFGAYVLRHLPVKDFRAYKIGNHLPDLMVPEEDPVIEYIFKKKGKEIKSEKYLSSDDGYEYVDSRILNEDKIVPKLVDFSLTDADGNDFTQEFLNGTKLVFVIENVSTAKTKNIKKISELITALPGGIDPLIMTASSEQEIEVFRHEHQLAAPVYFSDATVLKAMVRANPGIILIRQGTVKGKWHHNDTPGLDGLAKRL